MTIQEIGYTVAQERQKQQLTMYAVQEGSGVSIAQIRAIENGEKAYTLPTLKKVVDFLKLEIDIKQSDSDK